MLVDRSSECATLDRALVSARDGQSAVLVLSGEPGIGKTALLDYVAERALDCRVLRSTGVESEMEFAFAGLHQLCGPLLDELERLPPPQHLALATAFGMSAGPAPDRFLVGLAVLSLLSDAAHDAGALVCLVDDAQWLDHSSAQVLAFVARRLHADSVLLVLAERTSTARSEFETLPLQPMVGLPESDARELLGSVVSGPMDVHVRNQILAETRGNPLALLELTRELSQPGRADAFGLPSDARLPNRIETSFRLRVEQLPAPTRQLLLVAAAEPTGDPALLWRAAALLGIAPDAVDPAEQDGLLVIGECVAFRHPLLRSAIYRSAPFGERRLVHSALAEATQGDPDRRAWHRAHATLEPDEAVAAELETSATRAQARGGLAATAAFLRRAAELTPAPDRKSRRTLEAAVAAQVAGMPERALALLATAEAGPLGVFELARAQRLRGQIARDQGRTDEAAPLLLDAAQRLDTLDPDLAREIYLDALRAASAGARSAEEVQAVAAVARRAPRPTGVPRSIDLLLDGLAARYTDGYAASASPLQQALTTLREEDGRPGQDIRWPWVGPRVAAELFDDESWHMLATRGLEFARDAGALGVLPLALHFASTLYSFEGQLDKADELLDESDTISHATDNARVTFGRYLSAGCRGNEARATPLLDEGVATSEGLVAGFAHHARAVLFNGLGRYELALESASKAVTPDEVPVAGWALPELVEAAARCGQTEVAESALQTLSERTRVAGTDWALGVEARSRALLSSDDKAEELYREGIERLGRCRMALESARATLHYGEWLRRENRRVDARAQLRAAFDMYTAMGVESFAARAAHELSAAGETIRERSVEQGNQLTVQEAQIARLAAEGRTNHEIGAQLFISPRTVEWHLRKVFMKVGVSSRRQLAAAVPSSLRRLSDA
jgi:DNA-binding CsgD family transcriptional regulator